VDVVDLVVTAVVAVVVEVCSIQFFRSNEVKNLAGDYTAPMAMILFLVAIL
jgi:hypothetical protein